MTTLEVRAYGFDRFANAYVVEFWDKTRVLVRAEPEMTEKQAMDKAIKVREEHNV
jgi:hypothetical protein